MTNTSATETPPPIRSSSDLDWESVFNALNEGIWVLNLSGRVERCNRALAEIFLKKSADQVVGRFAADALKDVLSSEQIEQLLSIDSDSMKVKLQDGQVWASVITKSWFSSSGTLIGRVQTFTDVTDRQILLDEKAAREEEDRQRRATISHDLRAPLGAVMGFAELLQDPSIELDNRDELLRALQNNAQRLGKMIEELLPTSRRPAPAQRMATPRTLPDSTLASPMPSTATTSSEANSEKPAKDPVYKVSEGPRFDGLNVLVVEDSLDNQFVVKSFLGKSGAHVTVAANGREALNVINQQDFDLVLMDIQMPELDGYSTTRILRSSGFQKPIIALTAHVTAEHREHCRQVGCDGHIAKPIHRAQFLGTIAKVLEEKSSS